MVTEETVLRVSIKVPMGDGRSLKCYSMSDDGYPGSQKNGILQAEKDVENSSEVQ